MPQPSGRDGGAGTLAIGSGGGNTGGTGGGGGISWDIRTIKPEYSAAINRAVAASLLSRVHLDQQNPVLRLLPFLSLVRRATSVMSV